MTDMIMDTKVRILRLRRGNNIKMYLGENDMSVCS